jgi:hypothetical protein
MSKPSAMVAGSPPPFEAGPYVAKLWYPGKDTPEEAKRGPREGDPAHCTLCAERAARKDEVPT